MSCGTDLELLRLMVTDAVKTAVGSGGTTNGTPEMLLCDGSPWAAGARLATCDDVERVKLELRNEILQTELNITRETKCCGETTAVPPTDSTATPNIPDSCCEPPCMFYASVAIQTDMGSCDPMFKRVLYGYHADDERDTDADVLLKNPDGSPICYVYSNEIAGVTAPFTHEYADTTTTLYALKAPFRMLPRDNHGNCLGGVVGGSYTNIPIMANRFSANVDITPNTTQTVPGAEIPIWDDNGTTIIGMDRLPDTTIEIPGRTNITFTDNKYGMNVDAEYLPRGYLQGIVDSHNLALDSNKLTANNTVSLTSATSANTMSLADAVDSGAFVLNDYGV